MEIKQTLISALIPYINNARTHSDTQIAQIAFSIKEFGFNNPVLIDGDKGIIAGHGRVLAAQKLGIEQVPTIELAHLSEIQKRAYILADNKIALNAGWDEELLKLEFEYLTDQEIDIGDLGFSADEVNKLLGFELVEGLTDEDDIPEILEEPKTKLGDIYILGNHRLVCGDSLSAQAVSDLMGEELACMVFTDPPWNVAYGNDKTHPSWKSRTILNDNFSSRNEWEQFLDGIVSSLCVSMKKGAPIYCVMGASEWPAVDAALRKGGFHWSSTIIWAKDQLVLSRKDFHTQYEPIWYGWSQKLNLEGDPYEPIWYGWKEGKSRLVEVKDRKQSDLWVCKRPKRSDLHPTTKPVELIERAILNSSHHHNIVLDLFGGSGSTLIACEKTNRVCRTIELDPRYCDVIVKRWEDFTGKKAILSDL